MKNFMRRPLIACKRNADYYKDGTSLWAARDKAIIRSILLTMRITAAILLIGALQVSARGTAQKISFSGTNVPLTLVFHAIEEQTGYGVLMAKSTLESSKPVTVNLTNGSIDEVLKVCFSFQPWKLTYTISGKTISISKMVENVPSVIEEPGKATDIKGRILNEQGEPLSGATVSVKNSKKATSADDKGEFEFKNISSNAVIIISYLGYLRKEIPVESDKTMIIILAVSTSKLDKVQIIAYGSTSQRFSTGDVSTVSGTDIEKQPGVTNPLLALEGRVPGLFITQNSGVPGTGVITQIRGTNSISFGNDPFYVIDGVPYPSELLPNLGGILGPGGLYSNAPDVNGNGSPLSYINPSDIESISVLKDADATAIYGSRAANGAILITTKKGKIGKAKIGLNMQSGWGKITRKLDLLNRLQYLQMRHEAYANDGAIPGIYDAPDLLVWDTTRSTNWQDALIGGTAQISTLSGTVSGGSTATQYLIGATYHRQTTVFPGPAKNEEGSVHFNLQSVSDNQRFKIQLSGNYLIDNNRLPQTDFTSAAILTPPDAPALYTSDGKLNWAPFPAGGASWVNPVASIFNVYNSRGYNLISNAVISYEIIRGLDIKSSFGYNNLQINEYQINPLIANDPSLWPTTSRTASYVNNNMQSWIIEPQITYKVNIGNGRLDALIGSTINHITRNGQELDGSGYSSDVVLQNIKSASSVSVGSNISTTYKYAAAFGRLNYIWADKYLATVMLRRDGSSRFGPANQFHNFEAVSLGWIFSQEEFIKKALPFLSFGKLKGSYGSTGNDQIGDYQFMNLYTPPPVQVPYQGISGLRATGLTNPYLQWEETKKLEFGINLGFLKDNILISGDFFQNKSSNQLLGYNLSYITGFSSVIRNFPATIENYGWEFTISTNNFRSKNFSWSTNLNLTIPVNKLLSFPNLSSSSYASTLVIGQPLNIQKVFRFASVNDTTGIYQFYGAKGEVTNNPVQGTDNTSLININPVYYGGLQNNLRYKGIELDFLFQFVKQTGLNYLIGNVPGAQVNQPVSVLKRWQKPGDIAPIQRYNQDYSLIGQWSDAQLSDLSYSDASFIRLKNISLSWQLPMQWDKKITAQNINVYIQAQNLFTITKFVGMDPENQSSTSLPPLRVITVGMKVEF